MRILIIANHRSGSSSFGKWLSMELDYLYVFEPFNTQVAPWNYDIDQRINHMNNSNNIVCKCIYGQFSNKEEIKDLIKKFDKIIVLKRNNIKDNVISELMSSDTGHYHRGYVLTDNWLETNSKRIEERISSFIELNNEISKLEGLQITYEGIYDTKEDIERVKQYIEMNNINHLYMLDNKNRYRKRLAKKSLI